MAVVAVVRGVDYRVGIPSPALRSPSPSQNRREMHHSRCCVAGRGQGEGPRLFVMTLKKQPAINFVNVYLASLEIVRAGENKCLSDIVVREKKRFLPNIWIETVNFQPGARCGRAKDQ